MMTRILSVFCYVLFFLHTLGYGDCVSKKLSESAKSLRKNEMETTTVFAEGEAEKITAQPVVHPNSCVCSKIYDPVCGTDDKSYYNLCQMQCEAASNVTVVHQGNCILF